MQDTPIDRKKAELISGTEEPEFQDKVYQRALQLSGNKVDAQDYRQDALLRFISVVQSKKTLEELEIKHPLNYVYVILRNIHVDKLRKKSSPPPRRNQVKGSTEDTSEELGRQERELLAAQMEMSIEDIANRLQEEGGLGSTKLGMEEQVVSKMFVEAFIESLPEDLRPLTMLLTFEDYQLKELTEKLKRSYDQLKSDKEIIRQRLRLFQEQQAQLQKTRSVNG